MRNRLVLHGSPALALILLAGCSSKPSAPRKPEESSPRPVATAMPQPGTPRPVAPPTAQPAAHPVTLPPIAAIAPPPPPVAPPANRPPRGKLLSIVYTANAQGEVEPCG